MENINLIRKIAWSFHKTTGYEWDDLFQEAALAYLNAMKTYNPKRGKITTYVWGCITSHLKSYLRRQNKQSSVLDSIEDVNIDTPVFQDNMFESFSPDAQQIAKVVLRTPKKFSPQPACLARGRIMRVMMKRRGWSAIRIWNGMKDLKLAINSV